MTTVTFTGGARIERRGYCKVCGRARKNPKYAELGIGPVAKRWALRRQLR